MYKIWRAWNAGLVATVSDTDTWAAVAGYHPFPDDSTITAYQSCPMVRATAGCSTSTPACPSHSSWQERVWADILPQERKQSCRSQSKS